MIYKKKIDGYVAHSRKNNRNTFWSQPLNIAYYQYVVEIVPFCCLQMEQIRH